MTGAPAWSPDGKKIAFNNGALHLVNADGSGLTDLGHVGWHPDWLPDGSRIVFWLQSDNASLAEVEPDGSDLRELFPSDFADIAISSDGTRMAVNSGGGISIVEYPSGEPLTSVKSTGMFDSGPSWSPDGSKIAFSSWQTSHGEIWIANADGSDAKPLIADQPCLWSPTPMPGPSGCASDTSPTWSPDGTQIAFIRESVGSDIWVVNADGTGQRQITDTPMREMEPDWGVAPSTIESDPVPSTASPTSESPAPADPCVPVPLPETNTPSPAGVTTPLASPPPPTPSPTGLAPTVTPPETVFPEPTVWTPTANRATPIPGGWAGYYETSQPTSTLDSTPLPGSPQPPETTDTNPPPEECLEGASGTEVTAQAVGLIALGVLAVGSAIALPVALLRRRRS
jgi:TolB protein